MDSIVLAPRFEGFWPLDAKSPAFFELGGRFIAEYIIESLLRIGVRKIFFALNKSDRLYFEVLQDKLSEAVEIVPVFIENLEPINVLSRIASQINGDEILFLHGHDLFAIEFLRKLIKSKNSYIMYNKTYLRAIKIEKKLLGKLLEDIGKVEVLLGNKIETNYIFPTFSWHIIYLGKFFLEKILRTGKSPNAKVSKWANIEGKVFIDDGARVMRNAVISGPAYIGSNTLIGDHTLIRSSVIEGGVIIGCFMEVARSYIQRNVETHSGYLGDSILDERVHLGAGFISANLRLDRREILVKLGDKKFNTGLNKLGTIIGEKTEVGVNVSVMPGKLIGKRVRIWPGSVILQNINDDTDYIIKAQYDAKKRND